MPEFREPKRRPDKPNKRPPDAPLSERFDDVPKPRRKPRPKQTSRPPEKPPNRAKPPQARRPAAKKPQKRRRGKQNLVIYYMLLFALGVIVVSVLSVTVLFNINELAVEGESIYTDDAIVEASGIEIGMNMMRFSGKSAQEKILEELIYIDSVGIRKDFPSRLTIVVEGAVEMASILGDDGRYYTVSYSGRILEISTRPGGSVIIRGFELENPEKGGAVSSRNEKKREVLYTLIDAIDQVGLEEIGEIDLTDHLMIEMLYDNRILIELGAVTELETKLESAREMLGPYIFESETGRLRVSNPQVIVFDQYVNPMFSSIAAEEEAKSAEEAQNAEEEDTGEEDEAATEE